MTRLFAAAIITIASSVIFSSPIRAQSPDPEQLLKQKRFRQALELLRPDLGFRATRDMINMATRACLGLRLLDSALMFAQRSVDERETPEALFLLTRAASEAGKHDLAMKTAWKLVEEDPKNPKAVAEAGAAAVAADSLNQATKWLIAAREMNPEEPTVHEYLGDVYFKQSVYELAKMEYRDALMYDSLNTAPRWKLARIAWKEKQYNDALMEYRTIYRIDSTEIEALVEQANLYYIAGQYQNAGPYYLLYLEKNPDNPKARFYCGRTLIQLKAYAQAIEILTPLTKEQPANIDALRLIAEACSRLGKYDEAAEFHKKVTELGEATTNDFYQLGLSYSRADKTEEAIGAFNRAVEIDSANSEAYYELGLLNYKTDRLDEAFNAFRKKLELDPQALSALLNLGFTEFRLKRYDSAAVTFGRFTELKPDQMTGYLWLGRTYAQLDSLELEEIAYLKVVEIGLADSTRHVRELGEAYYSLSYVKAKQKDFRPAIEYIEKAIAIDEKNADYYVLLAQIYAQMNRAKEATNACKKALKIDPKNSNALKLLKAIEQASAPK